MKVDQVYVCVLYTRFKEPLNILIAEEKYLRWLKFLKKKNISFFNESKQILLLAFMSYQSVIPNLSFPFFNFPLCTLKRVN